MLWYKSWLETRWRFIVPLIVAVCATAAAVLFYPQFLKLLPAAASIQMSGELGRRVEEAVAISRTYRGYIYNQLIQQNLRQMTALFAALLGTGAGVSSSASTLFTLSMPASRNRLLGVRAAVGLAELAALTFVPALLLPLLSPAVGQSFGLAPALVHGLCLFIVGAAVFSLTLMLSAIFGDIWRPPVIALSLALGLMAVEGATGGTRGFGLMTTMSGASYFFTGAVPWVGLAISAGLSALLLWCASQSLANRDF